MMEPDQRENLKNETVLAEEPDFIDKEIVCVDCGEIFAWTAGEQSFFRDKNLKNPPKRCKSCKQNKNERLAAITSSQPSARQRIEIAVKCSKCEAPTTVPFFPSQGRPVYCRSCYLEINPQLLNGNHTDTR